MTQWKQNFLSQQETKSFVITLHCYYKNQHYSHYSCVYYVSPTKFLTGCSSSQQDQGDKEHGCYWSWADVSSSFLSLTSVMRKFLILISHLNKATLPLHKWFSDWWKIWHILLLFCQFLSNLPYLLFLIDQLNCFWVF